MRLDEQRFRADCAHRQANTSLEVRIHELENEVTSLKDTLHSRDKTIRNLNKMIDETKQRWEEKKVELSARIDDDTVLNLQREIERLSRENKALQTKVESDVQNSHALPGLVDNIILDKNAEIRRLRSELSDTRVQLEAFLSLNLDGNDLAQLSQLKISDRGLIEFLSLLDVDRARQAESQQESLNSPVTNVNKIHVGNNSDTKLEMGKCGEFCPEISYIEQVDPLKVDVSVSTPLAIKSSTGIQSGKQVRFDDMSVEGLERDIPSRDTFIRKLQCELSDLKDVVIEKDNALVGYEDRLKELSEFENKIEKLQQNLEQTEKILITTSKTFEKERSVAQDVEQSLRLELAEKKMQLTEKEKQLNFVEEDSQRKDKLFQELMTEKKQLEIKCSQLDESLNAMKKADEEIVSLQNQLSNMIENSVLLENFRGKLEESETQLNDMHERYKMLQHRYDDVNEKYLQQECVLKEKDETNLKLLKNIQNMNSQINLLTGDMQELRSAIIEKDQQIREMEETMKQQKMHIQQGIENNFSDQVKHSEELLIDNDNKLKILHEDVIKYKDELVKNKRDIVERDIEIANLKSSKNNLKKKLANLHECLLEKDRIMDQMKADTKSLHVNLETIQNKIQETGNIMDLRKRLQEEQHFNSVLQEQLESFRSIESGSFKERSMSIEEIAEKVQKELNYSAKLDSSILQALSSGDEGKEHEEIMKYALVPNEEYTNKWEQEKNALQMELQNTIEALEEEKRTVTRLRERLENDKRSFNVQLSEDTNLMERMRMQLQKFFDNEKELNKMLSNERRIRDDLKKQLVVLQTKLDNLSTSSSNSKPELTEYKSLPNMMAQEILQLQNQVATLNEENEKLKASVKFLKRSKIELEGNVRYAKDSLQTRLSEVKKLKEKLTLCKTELEQRTREVENSRVLMVS